MAKDKRVLNVVQWFKRISLCLNWASDCVSRFPDFETEGTTTRSRQYRGYYRRASIKIIHAGLTQQSRLETGNWKSKIFNEF